MDCLDLLILLILCIIVSKPMIILKLLHISIRFNGFLFWFSCSWLPGWLLLLQRLLNFFHYSSPQHQHLVLQSVFNVIFFSHIHIPAAVNKQSCWWEDRKQLRMVGRTLKISWAYFQFNSTEQSLSIFSYIRQVFTLLVWQLYYYFGVVLMEVTRKLPSILVNARYILNLFDRKKP